MRRCPKTHKHDATQTCYYNHGCRCAKCRALMASLREPTRLRVDAARSRDLIRELTKRGVTLAGIASAAGVAQTTLRRIATGKTKTVLVRTEQALLEVTTVRVAEIPEWRVRRRLQALIAIGWTPPQLAARVGCSDDAIHKIIAGEQTYVRRKLALPVFAVYEELQSTVPYAATSNAVAARTRAIRYAQAHNYAPPHAWDDIDNRLERPKGRTNHADNDLYQVAA